MFFHGLTPFTEMIRKARRQSHTHLSVYPMSRRVFGVFHCQLYNSVPVQKAGAGAHGKASHFLQTWDEKIHPEQKASLYEYKQAYTPPRTHKTHTLY